MIWLAIAGVAAVRGSCCVVHVARVPTRARKGGSMNDNDIADVLDRAADELLIRGWCKGEFGDGDGRVCVLGAVRVVLGLPLYEFAPENHPYYDASDILAAEVGDPSVAFWNDADDTTEDDVHDALRATAKKLRESS